MRRESPDPYQSLSPQDLQLSFQPAPQKNHIRKWWAGIDGKPVPQASRVLQMRNVPEGTERAELVSLFAEHHVCGITSMEHIGGEYV
jgi:hypothetical protein